MSRPENERKKKEEVAQRKRATKKADNPTPFQAKFSGSGTDLCSFSEWDEVATDMTRRIRAAGDAGEAGKRAKIESEAAESLGHSHSGGDNNKRCLPASTREKKRARSEQID